MATKTEDNIRRIGEIEAVQGNAGVGLTIGDVDDILAIVRSDLLPVARIADVIAQGWRSTADHGAQTLAIQRAVTILDAVRAHDAKYQDDRTLADLADDVAGMRDAFATSKGADTDGLYDLLDEVDTTLRRLASAST